jgi:hypothetical protein
MTEGTVLPIQAVLFQVVFLLVAIALEARVLYRKLRISRRTSVEYATSINLLTAVAGWLGFFLLQNLLPQPFRTQIISYVFFDRLLTPQPENWHLIIAATGIVMFFAAFLIKLKGLQFLEALLQRSPQEKSPIPADGPRLGLAARLERAAAHTDPNKAGVLLLANAYSHSAILLLLLLRFLQINPIS